MTGLGFSDWQANVALQQQVRGGEAPSAVEPADQPCIEGERDDQLHEEVSSVLLSLLPWAVSFLFHAGLVLLAIFVVWSTTIKVQEEEVIIPIARLSPTPGTPRLQQATEKSTKLDKAQRRVTSRQSPTKTISNVPSKVLSPTTLIGATTSVGGPMGATSVGSPLRTSMYGNGGNARHLTYVIDASGSLVDSLPFVIAELKRSITELSDKQSFTVIFFQGEDAIEVPPRGLKHATSENKQKVIAWIDMDAGHITPMGQSNPIKALKLALSYEPDLMFLLSDNITGYGRYELFQKRLLTEIEKANLGKTKINTIQFLYPDPLGKIVGLKPTMELIAEKTGGLYKFVDGRELGIE
jgi:hypothetical protein